MSIDTACQITNGQLVNPRVGAKRFRGVSIDTRTLRPGNAFFCLRGERTDGHEHATAAREGRAGVIFAEHGHARRWQRWDIPVIGVDDPLTALGDLAAEFRTRFPTRYIAVTGSVGKTTTKEMIAAVLSAKYDVYKSPGNFNNLIGIPLALLARNDKSPHPGRYGVLEFGMSAPGEIARLTEMVRPEWGVVTRIAPSHMMQMKSMAAIARAKRELFDHASDGTIAFLNRDDLYQCRWMSRWSRPTVTYGKDTSADVRADRIETGRDGTVSFRVNNRHHFSLKFPGEFNAVNALAAIAVGRRLGVSYADMAERLKNVRPVGHRSHIVRLAGITVIEDYYNANPESTTAALKTLSAWPSASRRIAVLGSMRELGKDEARWHRQVGRAAGDAADVLIAVGDFAAEYSAGAASSGRSMLTVACDDRKEAGKVLNGVVQRGDVVLIKASRSEEFEGIATALRECWSRGPAKARKRTDRTAR